MQQNDSNDLVTAPLIMRGTGATDVGLLRARNEDRFGIFESAGLAFVADGLGGHLAGDVASRIAAECVAIVAERIAEYDDDLTGSRLRDAILDEAHERLVDYQLSNLDALGMGTTLTLAWLRPDRLVRLLHIGDSRAYLLRDGTLTLLTRDHSIVGEMVERGLLTREEARLDSRRHLVTRYLGNGTAQPEPDLDIIEVQAGDRLLLCTDGLTDMLSEEQILEYCHQYSVREELVGILRFEANVYGGEDNITIVVIDILDHDDERPAHDVVDFTLEDLSPLREWAAQQEQGAPQPPHPMRTLTETQRQWLRQVRERKQALTSALRQIRESVEKFKFLDRHTAKVIFNALDEASTRTRGRGVS